MFTRILHERIQNDFFSGKILMLLGARQIGKTTLCNMLLAAYPEESIIRWNGDNLSDRDILSRHDLEFLRSYTEDKRIIFVDEAQKIQNIGDTLKLLVDFYRDTKQIIVTGSSSLHLLDDTSEPLTGRKYVYQMYAISMQEVSETYDVQQLERERESMMIYGSYPVVLSEKTHQGKARLLMELANSSLYRDILEFQQIRNSEVLVKLLRLLALQIGKEVSQQELATQLGIDTKTVQRYIDLLEKSYIVFRLPPYSTNKRKEISKSQKIFFWDLGIRNALIQDFNRLENRRDVGDLWENLMILERLKYNTYREAYVRGYFWRSNAGQEIDYMEEGGGKIEAYECKWGTKIPKIPSGFSEAYGTDIPFSIVSPECYRGFVGG